MEKEINSNKHNTITEVLVTALMSLIATETIGIVVSTSLFVLFYHKHYKVKVIIYPDSGFHPYSGLSQGGTDSCLHPNSGLNPDSGFF